MANSLLTSDIILKETLRWTRNNLVMARKVRRDFDGEFAKEGNKVGDTIRIRRPVLYNTRSTITAQMQDAVEGKLNIAVDKIAGADMRFPLRDLTLSVDQFTDRYIKKTAHRIAADIDAQLANLALTVPNWVTGSASYTAAARIDSSDDIAVAWERLADLGVAGEYHGIITPADNRKLASFFTGGQNTVPQEVYQKALMKTKIPMISEVDLNWAQSVASHTVANHAAQGQISATAQTLNYSYADVKDTMTMDLKITAGTASAQWRKGDVFTIANVFAVNPVTRVKQSFLKQFVVMEDKQNDANTSNDTTLKVYPALIASGPYQNVDAAAVAGAALTRIQDAAGERVFRSNIVFTEDAFGLITVPLELPNSGVKASRRSYDGINMRLVEFYDGINDINMWRIDVLYGVVSLLPDQATRVTG